MTAGKPNYVIISPVRDEQEFITKTIESVAAQSVRPSQWVIVNDGSQDNTGAIIDAAAKKHSWIKAVHRTDRGFRQAGGGVIEAFYDGFKTTEVMNWDYLAKLDGDLSFNSDYFCKSFERFESEPKLGVGGGMICGEVGGVLMEESKGDPAFHVRGATKIYQRHCWDAIGGLIKEPGWDTLDEVKANMLGWKTRTFRDLKLRHHRYTGNADGAWKNWVKNGRANYITGYHPAFMFCKCLKRLRESPFGLVSAGLWFGFVSAYFLHVPRVKDQALVRYVRQQQIRRLTFRTSLWDANRVESI